MRGPRHSALAVSLAVLAIPSTVAAQHDMHDMHGMGMASEAGWRMVPMDMNMPMLPGLMGAEPIVGPFMPGAGMDPGMLPAARPSEVVSLVDGDTLAISVSMVRRTINGHEMIMFGYNGQYPGPAHPGAEGRDGGRPGDERDRDADDDPLARHPASTTVSTVCRASDAGSRSSEGESFTYEVQRSGRGHVLVSPAR